MQRYIAIQAGKRTALNHWIDNSFKTMDLRHETVTKNFLLAALGLHPLTQCDLPKGHHDYSESCDGITLISKSIGVKQSMSKEDLVSMFINRYQSHRLVNNRPLKKKLIHKLDTMSEQALMQLAMDRGFKDGEAVEFIKNGVEIRVRRQSLLDNNKWVDSKKEKSNTGWSFLFFAVLIFMFIKSAGV